MHNMASKFSAILRTVHIWQLERRLFSLNTCEKNPLINSDERFLLIKGCFLLLICKGSDSLSAVWKPSSYWIKGKRFVVTRAYRNSLNTHHQLWCWPAHCTSAVLQLVMTLVNAPQPPPAWASLPAASHPPPPSPPPQTSCSCQCNFAVSFSKYRKYQKTVTPCIGEGKHNWTCLPHQDTSK